MLCQTLLQELDQLRAELRRAQQEKDDERRAKDRTQADLDLASRQAALSPGYDGRHMFCKCLF